MLIFFCFLLLLYFWCAIIYLTKILEEYGVMAYSNLEQQRRRVRNIELSEKNNRSYFKRHRIRDYLPGQVVYSLSDYPAKASFAPTNYDIDLVRDLAKRGVGLIQLHEDWNDSVRVYGADKYSCYDPDGLKEFVKLCHSEGIKVIPYVSTGYIHEFDPDFRPEFIRLRSNLRARHLCYLRCNPASEYWREFIINKNFQVIDEYGFDGIYNDMGYDKKQQIKEAALARGETEYTVPYGFEIEDLLSTIYSGIKERGGIYKLHADSNLAPACKDKVYDYLWIGESMTTVEYGVGKDYYQYVVPCPDFQANVQGDYHYHVAKSVPFMQFPLIARGRPLLGLAANVDGVTYYQNLNEGKRAWHNEIFEYMKEHPNGPYVYGLWSSIPDAPENYDVWSHYLALYRPMVMENSLCYVELRDSEDIISPLEGNVFASMFVNEERYIVLSNFTGKPYELKLSGIWENRENGVRSSTFTVENERVLFLKEIFIG